MIKTLQNTLKQDKEQFTVPKSVQDAIPIRRIWPDGVFQFGSKFSKCIRFSDINYAIASKEDKTAMFLNYSELLNALDTGSTTKITINNKRLNRQNFEETILLPPRGDFLDGYRAEYNAMLTDKVTDSSNSVVQERYITVRSTTSGAARAWSSAGTPAGVPPCRSLPPAAPVPAPTGPTGWIAQGTLIGYSIMPQAASISSVTGEGPPRSTPTAPPSLGTRRCPAIWYFTQRTPMWAS